MKLNRRAAPHIRFPESNQTLMSDMIILLLVLCVLAFLYYGGRALIVCAVSVVTAVVCDALCTLIRGRRPNPRDLSPVVTGLIIALTMPATIPYYVVASRRRLRHRDRQAPLRRHRAEPLQPRSGGLLLRGDLLAGARVHVSLAHSTASPPSAR